MCTVSGVLLLVHNRRALVYFCWVRHERNRITFPLEISSHLRVMDSCSELQCIRILSSHPQSTFDIPQLLSNSV